MKHYQRLKRTGDPTTINTAGRKPSPSRAEGEAHPEWLSWSSRTRDTYLKALNKLPPDMTKNERKVLAREAIRADGTLNVAAFARLASQTKRR